MSIHTTEALVIGSTNLVEAHRIIALYSPVFGQIRGVAHGIKGMKSRFGSSLEPLTHVNLIFAMRLNRELQLIKQADIVNSYPEVRSEIPRLAAGLYAAELIQKMTPVGGDGQPPVFFLMLKMLDLLSLGADIIPLVRIVEARLLALLGYKPQLEECVECHAMPYGYGWGYSPSKGGVVCPSCRRRLQEVLPLSPGGVKFLKQAMNTDINLVGRLKVLPSLRDELEQALQKTLLQHLSSPLKSYPVFQKLVSGNKNPLSPSKAIGGS